MRTFLLTVAVTLVPVVTAVADDEVAHTISTSVARGSIRRVIVDIPAGEVSVRNGNADRIAISGEVSRDYDGHRLRNKQQRIVDDIDVEIFVNRDEALIRRKFGPNAQTWSAKSWHSNYRLTVEVPRGLDVDIETRYGELKLEGEFGDVNIDLRAGEVHLRTPRASVHELNASVRIGEVHTNFGESREDHEGIFPSRTHFVNTGGRSRINVHTTVGELHVTLTR